MMPTEDSTQTKITTDTTVLFIEVHIFCTRKSVFFDGRTYLDHQFVPAGELEHDTGYLA